MLQAGGDGHLVAEIARQGQDPHPRIGLLEVPQEVQRGVAAAVVDIDDLEVEIGDGGDGVQGGDEAAMGLADDRFLVEAGETMDRSTRATSVGAVRFITGTFSPGVCAAGSLPGTGQSSFLIEMAAA